MAVENTNNKIIIVGDSSLKFLEKFGLKVYCLDSNTTDKEIDEVNKLITSGAVNYIFKYKNDEINSTTKKIININPTVKTLEFNKLDNITDDDRTNGKDYITLMNENLDTLKQELYQ